MKSSNDNIKELFSSNIKNSPNFSSTTTTTSSSILPTPFSSNSPNTGRNENNSNNKTLSNAELINMIKGGSNGNNMNISNASATIPTASTSSSFPTLVSTNTASASASASASFNSKGLASSSASSLPSSPQDDHGMLGLMNIIKTTHGPNPSLALGIDPDQLGLCSLESSDPIHRNFLSPWCDTDRTGGNGTTILDNYLPNCYNVQPSPSVVTKLSAFADETLFYMFYAMPKDRMQELAAHELTLRQWRYHKELKVWMIREDIFTNLNQQFGNLRLASKSPVPFGMLKIQQQTPPPPSVDSASSLSASPLKKKIVNSVTNSTGANSNSNSISNSNSNINTSGIMKSNGIGVGIIPMADDGNVDELMDSSILSASCNSNSKLSFVVFDPQTWSKVKREMIIVPNEDVFENRFHSNSNETLGNTTTTTASSLSLSSTAT